MTYGFDLGDELRARLRGDLAVDTRAWIEGVTNTMVSNSRPLDGGRSSAVHMVTFRGGERAVVRDWVLEWTKHEPWVPHDEAAALRWLERTSLPVPKLLAADPAGENVGRPLLLMTALDGSIVWNPQDLDAWLDELVHTVVAIHSTPTEGLSNVYEPHEAAPVPAWTNHVSAWQTAATVQLPDSEQVLIHRDFHPGNVLWEHGLVTGIVDWAGACIGPAEADIAHCRINLAMHHGLAVADAFLARWLDVTGRDEYDRRFDLAQAVSMPSAEPQEGLDAIVSAAMS